MRIESIIGGVCAPQGFLAGGIHCGMRKNREKKDLALIKSVVPCQAAAVFTTNKVFGAPVKVSRENLQNGVAQAVVCNSGNANTCTSDGDDKARKMCEMTGAALGVDPSDVIVASTGVIGVPMPIEPIEKGIAQLAPLLSEEGGTAAAAAIMTTDTQIKELAVKCEIGGKTVKIGGISKGSGMINPNMATMLSFITTDCAIQSDMLKKALKTVADDTYNMVSVDGDTSTNDMVCVMANGLAGNDMIEEAGEDFTVFTEALRMIAAYMSRLIAGDGEGATKLLECTVTGAPDKATAKIVAKSVISSSLFKAAMFGADANWGRVLCAIGYAKAEFDVHPIDVFLGSGVGRIKVCEKAAEVEFSEEEAARILREDEIRIEINMNQGGGNATAWGCDLTYDYVKINGDYRS